MADVQLRIKNQASLFLRGLALDPGGAQMIELLQASQRAGFDFIPSSFQQVELTSGQIAARLKLSSPKTGLEILFPQDRIDIVVNAIDETGSTVGEYEDFRQTVTGCFSLIEPLIKRKFHRMAAISELLLSMNGDQLQEAFKAKMVAGSLHTKNPAYEWNSRAVSKVPFASITEQGNVISNLSRVQGEYRLGVRSVQFDTLHLELDINTLPSNDAERFEGESFLSFLSEANELMIAVREDRLSGL